MLLSAIQDAEKEKGKRIKFIILAYIVQYDDLYIT